MPVIGIRTDHFQTLNREERYARMLFLLDSSRRELVLSETID